MNYFKHKLDDKARLTIPAEVRGEFGEGKVVVAPGFNNKYLHLYSEKTWNEELQTSLEGKWKTAGDRPAILDEELADLADKLYEGMVETTLDAKQGRVTISQELLASAGLTPGGWVSATKMPGGYWRLKKPQV